MVLVTYSGQTAPKKLIVHGVLENQIKVGTVGVVLTKAVVLLDNLRDLPQEYSLEYAGA